MDLFQLKNELRATIETDTFSRGTDRRPSGFVHALLDETGAVIKIAPADCRDIDPATLHPATASGDSPAGAHATLAWYVRGKTLLYNVFRTEENLSVLQIYRVPDTLKP